MQTTRTKWKEKKRTNFLQTFLRNASTVRKLHRRSKDRARTCEPANVHMKYAMILTKEREQKITFEKCYNQYVKIDTFVRGFSIHFTLCHPNAFRVTLKTIRNRGKDRSALLFICVEKRSSVRYKPHTVFRADPLITFQHDRMPEFILVFRVCCWFFLVGETFVVSIFRRIPRKGYGCTRKICKQKVLQRKWLEKIVDVFIKNTAAPFRFCRLFLV